MAKAKTVFTPVADIEDNHKDDHLAESMALVPALEEWIKAVKADVFTTLKDGKPVTGYKLVEGRRTRAWVDTTETEAYLRQHKVKVGTIFDQKLKSPAQMEKALKGTDIELADLITHKAGSLTVAPDSDKRRAVTSTADAVFNAITK